MSACRIPISSTSGPAPSRSSHSCARKAPCSATPPSPGTPAKCNSARWFRRTFLEAARVQPMLGRGFRPEEDSVPGRDAVVIVSYEAWVNLFHSETSVLGRRIWLSGHPFTIVGVTPESFTGLETFVRPAFYVPLMMSAVLEKHPNRQFLNKRDRFEMEVNGRLKPGVARSTAEAELAAFAKNLATAYPASHRERGMTTLTEFEERVKGSPPDAAMVAMLMAIVALVMLIACANVANLLLARGRARAREVAVRLAMGANRGRLFRQLFTESLLLALVGCGLGVALGYLGIRAFAGVPLVGDVPIYVDVWLDRRVLIFSVAVALLSAVIFGVVPALRSLRPDLVGALKAGELEDHSRRSRWFGRHALVAGQLALSCVLLVAAAMAIAGVKGSLLQDPGFRRANILTAMASPFVAGYDEPQTRRFYDLWLQRSREIPGVRAAALTSALPTANSGIDFDGLIPEGYALRPNEKSVTVFATTVSDGYFEVFDIPMVAGRAFTSTDTRDKPPVAIVNDVFAQKVWPNQNPIGRRFRRESEAQLYEVIGVAKRSRYLFISEGPTAAVYYPAAQRNRTQLKLLVRTDGDPLAAVTPVREVLRGLDANLPLQNVRTMEDYHQKRTVAIVNLLVGTVGTLGLCGLLLALIGLYGVMAYSVSRRTREIGIRMAIGAGESGIVALVMKQGGIIALVGTLIGLLLSLAATPLLQGALLGLAVAHPLVYVAVPLLLLLCAAAACWWPARRAARVAPVQALRCE
ncbi:MAG: ADOP family duplicated permease [Bryobacteraceae bacterium]|nr:ADOP family duplicated permease [Bryobacteraceae bacterium]